MARSRVSESLLLDTHVWYWLSTEERKVSAAALRAITSAARRHAVAVSEVSFWELATKAAKGKLELRPDPAEWLRRASSKSGLGVIDLDREILVRSAQLDWEHRDPADRMLVATAMFYDLRLATADPVILEHARTNRRLQVLNVMK